MPISLPSFFLKRAGRWPLLICAGLLLGCEKEAPPTALTTQASSNAENPWFVKEDLARIAAEHVALSPEVEAQRQHSRTDADTQRVFAGWQRLRSLTPLLGRDNQPFVYVANYQYGGWALIAADAHMQPLLGFSEHGSFAVEQLRADGTLAVTLERNRQRPTMPEGMLDWLEITQDLVATLRANPDAKNTAQGAIKGWSIIAINHIVISELPNGGGSGQGWRIPGGGTGGGGGDPGDEWPPAGGGGGSGGTGGGGGGGGGSGGGTTYIFQQRGPLLRTTWGQGCGYNDFTPNGTYSCNRTPTGCVPTAMAQVLYFHRFPANFNWAGMPLGPYLSQGSAPDLARLMRMCGISVGVSYSNSGSSANTADVEGALKGTLLYTSPFGYRSADYRDGNAVNPAINNDLDAGRPTIVAGRTSSSGHAWVCDGYVFSATSNSTGIYGFRRYNMNWGWNGSSNGLFMCDDWNVTTSDGTVHNFQYNHRAIVNIHP